MHLPHYPLISDQHNTVFDFESEGPRGKIQKSVRYSKIHVRNVFNLSFGDINPLTGKIDDQIISDNGDTALILATVAFTIYTFTGQYPEAFVYMVGSTKSRTRLYQIAIGKFLSLIKKDFEVYAEQNQVWVPFEKGINYDSFLIKRKRNLEI